LFPEINSFDPWFFDDTADRLGVSPVAVVQDYAVTVVLYYLYRNNMVSDCVFKGGTSIKKIYFPDARFSVDLDFDSKYSMESPAKYATEFEMRLNRLVNNVLGSVYIYEIERIETSLWLFFNIKYRVFDYDELTRINVDYGPARASFVKQKVYAEPYISDMFSVDVYPVETILEQKVIALIDRNTAKDLWGVYFLHITKGVKPDNPLRKIVEQYNGENNTDFDLRKILFIVDDIISESDFMILSEIYMPSNIQRDFDKVRRGVREFIEEYWNFR